MARILTLQHACIYIYIYIYIYIQGVAYNRAYLLPIGSILSNACKTWKQHPKWALSAVWSTFRLYFLKIGSIISNTFYSVLDKFCINLQICVFRMPPKMPCFVVFFKVPSCYCRKKVKNWLHEMPIIIVLWDSLCKKWQMCVL